MIFAPPVNETRHLDTLQVCRGLAALAVVYHHLWVFGQRFNYYQSEFNGPWAYQGKLGVDFFFVLSGFIITRIHGPDLGHAPRLLPYAVKRGIRIFPLLWTLLTVKLVFMAWFPMPNLAGKADPGTILVSYLLIPADTYLIDVQWTLVCEMMFYVMFGFWIVCGRKSAWWSGGAWAVAVIMVQTGALPATSTAAKDFLLSPLVLEFLGGAMVAACLSRGMLTFRPAVAVTLSSLAAIAAGVVFTWENPAFWAPVLSLFVGGLASLDLAGRVRWPRWLGRLGDASYSIYLLHSSVQAIIFYIGNKYRVPFSSAGQILVYATGIVSVIAGVLCHKYLEYPMLKACRRKLVTKSANSPSAKSDSAAP